MQILGDRILPKTLQANDKNRHIVGRYMQVFQNLKRNYN